MMLTRRHRPSEPSALARVLAVTLAFSVFALGLLAVSPQAHAAIHPDAAKADHVCAVTIAAHGFCDTVPQAPVSQAPAVVEEISFVAPTHVVWSAPEYWHVPAQAPPRG
jgi:hypothetical protein